MARVLGVDYGDVRVGLALSDSNKIIARPFKTLINKNSKDLLINLEEIINQNEIDEIVIGVPYNMSGQDTKQTEKVREFIAILKQKFELSINLIDERLTSIEAEGIMHKMNIKTGSNKGKIDKIAASIILQEHLDSHHV